MKFLTKLGGREWGMVRGTKEREGKRTEVVTKGGAIEIS